MLVNFCGYNMFWSWFVFLNKVNDGVEEIVEEFFNLFGICEYFDGSKYWEYGVFKFD